MNGQTVMASLKTDEATREIPILVCTADDRPETAENVLAAGCRDVLLKPFSSEQLLDAVGRILRPRPDEPPPGPIAAA